jgi:hypothetical protein
MTVDEYKAKNKELFERWKTKHFEKYGQVGFVTDGIIDLSEFANSEERIMFLLKEAYDKKSKAIDWDEAKWLNQEKCTDNCTKKVKCNKCTITGNTFNFIASVVYGITEITIKNYDSWLGIENHNNREYETKRRALLRKIAIVNIKKSGGIPQSSDDDLYYYAAYDKDLLIEQINLIKPTLIICGGTYKYLRCIFTDLPRLEDTSNGSCVYNSIKIIAAQHPNSRGNGEEKYNNILANYNKL